MWLPLRPDDRCTFDRFMFPFGSSMVRCCNCTIYDPCQFPPNGIRMCRSGRKATIFRRSGTACHSHNYLCSGRCIGLLNSVSQTHTNAHSVWCFLVHGNIVLERITGKKKVLDKLLSTTNFLFQMFTRILIIFMPAKYQPDLVFLRQVPIGKVHLFTAIQLACFSCLWVVKSYKSTSICFPLMVSIMLLSSDF